MCVKDLTCSLYKIFGPDPLAAGTTDSRSWTPVSGLGTYQVQAQVESYLVISGASSVELTTYIAYLLDEPGFDRITIDPQQCDGGWIAVSWLCGTARI